MANSHSLDLELSSSQYASVADTAPLSITGDITLMTWVNLESAAADMVFASKHNISGDQRGYTFNYDNASGKILFGVSSDGTAANFTTALSNYGYFQTGVWFHVAVTYNAAAGTCKFYLNGALDSTGSGLKTSIFNNTAAFGVGCDFNGASGTNFFDGLTRAVRVFNAELTAAQVLAEMHASASANSPVGAWELNNAYTDSSGNGADLTPSGSPVFSATVPFADSGTTLTVQTTGVIDTIMDSSVPTWNYGAREDFYVGEHNAGVATYRSLLKHALTDIPAGSTINSAFLILTF